METFLKSTLSGLIALATASSMELCAAETPPVNTDEGGGDVTVITSEKMVYDSQKQTATFEENVQVADPEIELSSDKLTAEFNKDSEVEFIRAEGNVYIEQNDKKAWAQFASYNMESGKVVLKGEPLIKKGKDMLQGDSITFWRNESRMVCEPNARLTIHSENTEVRDQFDGKE